MLNHDPGEFVAGFATLVGAVLRQPSRKKPRIERIAGGRGINDSRHGRCREFFHLPVMATKAAGPHLV